jgi:antitoxin component YwqK of YwqJK toxin-antitoxin module
MCRWQVQWFYPDGSVERLVTFKEGIENGNAYYFYQSGALKHHRFWVNGKMTGYVCDYFDDSTAMTKNVLLYNAKGELVYKKSFDSLGQVISEVGHK